MVSMSRRLGRPRGTFGPVARALLQAAVEPGTVDDLARRALVGRSSAHYTVARLLKAGELEVIELRARPAVLRCRQQRRKDFASELAMALATWR
jgi:hypothetical protein